MKKKDVLTKILAIIGTTLIWLPIVAAVIIGIVFLFRAGFFRIDYLIPAEVFPIELIGMLLLLWAAIRSKYQWKLILGCIVFVLVCLAGSIILADVSGLASGARDADGFWYVLVLTLLILFDVGLMVLGVIGILFIRRLFKSSGKPDSSLAEAIH